VLQGRQVQMVEVAVGDEHCVHGGAARR
jgi:hypothetical protein